MDKAFLATLLPCGHMPFPVRTAMGASTTQAAQGAGLLGSAGGPPHGWPGCAVIQVASTDRQGHLAAWSYGAMPLGPSEALCLP